MNSSHNQQRGRYYLQAGLSEVARWVLEVVTNRVTEDCH